MVYEIDFELPVYDGGNCTLRFSNPMLIQGVPVDYIKGSYSDMVSKLRGQLQELRKVGEDVQVYVDGGFLDLSRSPVLRGVSNFLSSDFFDLKKSITVRLIRNSLEKKV